MAVSDDRDTLPRAGPAAGSGPVAGSLAGDAEAVRATFEQAPILLGGFAGREYRVDAANAACRSLIGRPDIVGRAAPEVFPELAGQQVFGVIDRVWASGVPEALREWRLQFDRGATGELDEIFLDMVLTPRHSADGTMTGVTVVASEVTEQVRRRQSEQNRTAEAQRRYEAARDVIVGVQEALLATSLPVLPGAILAARYLVASQDQAAGGDWFDAVPLTDGTVALVVGDIVGHGVAASAAMGQMRSVLNAVLTETGDLGQALTWADGMAARTPAMRAATVCIAVLDPRTGAVRYSTCGHPPPLIAGLDGSVRYLEPSGNGPLGTGSTWAVADEHLQVGEVLMLFTDGLIERPGQSLQSGMDALADIVGDAVRNRVMPVGAPPSAAERACEQGVELATRTGYDDDVTALAVQRRRAPITPFSFRGPAEPAQIVSLRAAMLGWLRGFTPSLHDEQAIDLAVTELAANAIEHAYRPEQTGEVRVRADLGAEGVLRVQVADDGTWREPTGPADISGRGLWLAGSVLDDLQLNHPAGPDGTPAGTTATVRHRLQRPVAFRPGAAPAPEPRPAAAFAAVLETGGKTGGPRTLRVSGPLDILTADRFADRLGAAGRGGVHEIVLDLSDVEILASAAVRVLFQARDQFAAHGHPLTVHASAGTAAAQVLELVGLENRKAEIR